MNQMLTSFADYLYNRLPSVYRTNDRQKILRRFVELFAEGGFNPLMQESMAIMDLIDIDKCPSKFLPQLCKMYGYEYTKEIPELFQRRLLKYIVELYKRKGTKSSIKFIARELTGFDSEIIENKDFSPEDIKVTKWDKRFEHYRNFILKLTAPFEDSLLYNKEEILVKVINNFLPTNSQMLVITSYWFQEESNLIKKITEEEGIINVTVTDDEATMLVKKSTTDYSNIIKLIDTYSKVFMGDEKPFSVTESDESVLVNIQDKVTMRLIRYDDIVIKGTDDLDSVKIVDKTIDEEKVIDKSQFEEGRTKVKIAVVDFTSDIVAQSEDILSDTIRPLIEDETTDISQATTYLEFKIRQYLNEGEEPYLKGRIIHNTCDIIGTDGGEETHTIEHKVLSQETTKLNVSNLLITNSIYGWDTIKEVGKPDRYEFI